jgi:hypothetical protein
MYLETHQPNSLDGWHVESHMRLTQSHHRLETWSHNKLRVIAYLNFDPFESLHQLTDTTPAPRKTLPRWMHLQARSTQRPTS